MAAPVPTASPLAEPRASATIPTALALMGETASGKTALAIALARTFDAEIVCADSRQVYAGMEVGTAAPTPAERRAVPHHLVAFLDPAEAYSAARFAADACRLTREIAARGRRTIVVGGTGFYLRALTGDRSLGPEPDPALRARLRREGELHEPAWLHAWLARVDPGRAAALAPTDRYRVLRALEVALARRAPRGAEPTGGREGAPSYRVAGVACVKLWAQVEPAALEARIAARAAAMLAGGLLEEATRVGAGAVAASAVGYPTALAYLAGQSTREECLAQLARATRRYAKRQRTWLRGEPDLIALPPGAPPSAVVDEVARRCGWPRAGRVESSGA